MAKLMTDLGLDTSSDQVKDEEVDNHNYCATKLKESLKLNKSGKVKKKRDVTKSEIEQKCMIIFIYWQYYVGSHSY
jgi:hypothetical protein